MNNVKALISLPHYMDDKPTFWEEIMFDTFPHQLCH
jgi:hypothetical protein